MTSKGLLSLTNKDLYKPGNKRNCPMENVQGKAIDKRKIINWVIKI